METLVEEIKALKKKSAAGRDAISNTAIQNLPSNCVAFLLSRSGCTRQKVIPSATQSAIDSELEGDRVPSGQRRSTWPVVSKAPSTSTGVRTLALATCGNERIIRQ